MINDRNPRGAYGGFYPMVVYVRGGKVVAADGGALDSALGLGHANAQCRQLGYELP